MRISRQVPGVSLLLLLLWLGVIGFAFDMGGASLMAEEKGAALPQIVVPQTKTAPVIDGALNETAWKTAGVIEGLYPARGGKYQKEIDAVPTTVRLLWDAAFLYVSYECIDDDIHVTGTLKHDENIYMEDVCEIFIDGKGDGRQWIEIQVSPLNQTLDLMYLFTGTAAYSKSMRLVPDVCRTDLWSFREWEANGVKTASGRLVRDGIVVGWTVEMAIPAQYIAKRQGKKTLEPMEFRANFMRYDHQPDADGQRQLIHMNWAPVQHGCPHISPAAMGRVVLAASQE